MAGRQPTTLMYLNQTLIHFQVNGASFPTPRCRSLLFKSSYYQASFPLKMVMKSPWKGKIDKALFNKMKTTCWTFKVFWTIFPNKNDSKHLAGKCTCFCASLKCFYCVYALEVSLALKLFVLYLNLHLSSDLKPTISALSPVGIDIIRSRPQ